MGRNKHKKHNKNKPGVPKHGEDPSLVSDPSTVIPKSLVFRRGKIGLGVHSLVHDMRLVMAPNTAAKLKETSANSIRDFLSIAPGFGVTHFLMFSQAATTGSAHLRVVRIPRGPTLSFGISSYTTIRDITNMQSRPHSHSTVALEYKYAPLVVLNNFNQQPNNNTNTTTPTPSIHATNPVKLMAAMFQNLFPPLDVTKLRLSECRRVVLINYNSADGSVDFRHFMIEASPVGLTKQVKRIIKAKIPNLNRLDDIADLLTGEDADYAAQMSSDSEAEDTPETRITLGQHFAGRGNRRSGKSAIRLREVGPRMTLNLIKIEEEFCTGRVLYHAYHSKSEAEQEQLQRMKQQREAEKAKRKEQQAANVAAKQQKGRRGKRAREEAAEEGGDEGDEFAHDISYGDGSGSGSGAATASAARDDDDDMNDADWYRLEVGERPDRDMFDEREKKRSHKDGTDEAPAAPRKKARTRAEGSGLVSGNGSDEQAANKPKSRKGRSSKPTWIRGRGGKAHNTDRPSSSRGRGAPGAARGRGGSGSSRGGGGSRGRGGSRGGARGRGRGR